MINRRDALALLMVSAALPAFGAGGALAARHAGEDDSDDARGIPNMFISPCGEPFRGAAGAPYPVVDWFSQCDTNRDGKLDRSEFVADAERFFKKLDLNGDGALSRHEVQVYEQNWVPEILGGNVTIGQNAGAKLWLAQYGPAGALNGANAPINPQGDKPVQDQPKPKGLDETGAGASPYSFFDEPEPVMAADFNVNGLILKDNFLKLADMHFDALDPEHRGYLTLNSLPQTAVEKLLGRTRRVKN